MTLVAIVPKSLTEVGCRIVIKEGFAVPTFTDEVLRHLKEKIPTVIHVLKIPEKSSGAAADEFVSVLDEKWLANLRARNRQTVLCCIIAIQ
jgi:hypothetical protein